MSLFYGKEDPPGANNQNQHPDQPKKIAEYSFKEKQRQKGEGGSRASIFLAKDKQPQKEPGCCDKCCNCCTCPSLAGSFKVTNKDVAKRLATNIKFWSGGFFTPQDQEYDMYHPTIYRYGPFWLYTTMIFAVGAVHNILLFSNTGVNFKYDFEIFAKSVTVFYGLGLLLSALLGLIYGCLGIPAKTGAIVCLYGYSMATYIICVLLCSVNMTLLTWIFLLYAAVTKVIYILKNLFEMEVPAGKKFVITVLVLVQAGLQVLIIKFIFIKSSADGSFSAAFSHMSTYGHQEVYSPILHMRTHN